MTYCYVKWGYKWSGKKWLLFDCPFPHQLHNNKSTLYCLLAKTYIVNFFLQLEAQEKATAQEKDKVHLELIKSENEILY